MIDMKNPCKDILQLPRWTGYVTNKGCDICGNKPAQIEPRFGYTSCSDHSQLNPMRFSRIKDGLDPDPLVVD